MQQIHPYISIDIVAVLQGLLTAVVVPGTIMLVRRLSAIREHLASLNGRLGKVETRACAHEKLDDDRLSERMQQSEQCRAAFRRELDSLKDRIDRKGV